MIVVTGATGKLGRAIVQNLAKLVPAGEIGVSVRDPAKADDLAELGVRVRRGDFAEPASLAHAFAGVSQLLIISSNAAAYGGNALEQHGAAIDAARAAGAKRIVYTSHAAASASSAFAPMLDHAATEAMLRDCGVAWTSLRNGFYADSSQFFLGDAVKSGVLSVPADGKVAWTAHADLAEAAAILLQQPGRFEGPTPPLTGPQALNLAEVAALVRPAEAQPVTRTVVPDADYSSAMVARGTPSHVARILLSFYVASRNGEFAAVDPTLASVVNRPLVTVEQVLSAKLAA